MPILGKRTFKILKISLVIL